MNRTVASKEALLGAAEQIARRNGLSAISIRGVAAACGVSVGTVYNYFPAKADLVVAVLEGFWHGVFHSSFDAACLPENFVGAFAEIYKRFSQNLVSFESGLLWQAAALTAAERQKGRAVEAHYWVHIKHGLRAALDRDPAISPDVWNADVTRDAFVDFVFDNMMASLRHGRPDCNFFLQILSRLLYS